MIEDMKNGDKPINNESQNILGRSRHRITEQRRMILNQISEILPLINQIYVPQKFQTQMLQKLTEFIRYSIPIEYIAEDSKKLLLELTQYYYGCCLGQIKQNEQNSNDISLEVDSSNIIQQTKNVELEEKKIIGEIQQKPTEISIKIESQINQKQNITKNTNTYEQILSFISEFEKLPKMHQEQKVSLQTVLTVQKMNTWPKSIQKVQFVLTNNRNNKNAKRKWQTKSQNQQSDIETTSSIKIGCNEDEETKALRQELKKRAQNNFKEMSQKKESVMSQEEKTKTNMHFQLNKVSLENIDQIFQQLKPYVAQHIKNEESSLVLIQKIIEKCENQHYRYVGTYARLCQKISTIPKQNFISHEPTTSKKNKGNLFKRLLIQHLQIQFDSKITNKNIPDSPENLRFFKYQFVGCLIFIAELIKLKVLSQKIINICLATMILATIQCIKSQKYSQTTYFREINESYLEIYLQGIIKFIETLGVHYNCISIRPNYNGAKLKNKILEIATSQHPNYNDKEIFDELCLANSQGYLSILQIVNQNSYRECRESSRIDLLIMNIIENFNYALIQQCEQEQDQIQESKILGNQQDKIVEVTPQIKEILQFCTRGPMEQSVQAFKNVIQSDSPNRQEKVISFLRLIADAKEDDVIYRLKIFKKALQSFDNPQTWLKSFKSAWFNDFKYLSTLGSDLKYLTQVLAQIIRMAMDQERVSLNQYSVECDDEDQLYFMNEISSKLYEFGDS